MGGTLTLGSSHFYARDGHLQSQSSPSPLRTSTKTTKTQAPQAVRKHGAAETQRVPVRGRPCRGCAELVASQRGLGCSRCKSRSTRSSSGRVANQEPLAGSCWCKPAFRRPRGRTAATTVCISAGSGCSGANATHRRGAPPCPSTAQLAIARPRRQGGWCTEASGSSRVRQAAEGCPG